MNWQETEMTDKLPENPYLETDYEYRAFTRGQQSLINAGWKSPEQIAEIIKQSAEALSDKHNREVSEAKQEERERIIKKLAGHPSACVQPFYDPINDKINECLQPTCEACFREAMKDGE